MASSPITSWQIDRETMKTVRDFILGGSKITADGDCSHEIKRCLLLGKKAIINLQSILKSRDITLPTKVHLVKAMGFPVVMYGWELDYKESWALNNWCFRTAVLEKTPESPLDCKEIPPGHPKGNRSWICIGRTDAEADTTIFWPPDAKRPWFWERLKAGGEGDDRGWEGWMASPTRRTWVWVNSGSWWWTGGLACCDSWGHKELDTTEQLNWTELDWCAYYAY